MKRLFLIAVLLLALPGVAWAACTDESPDLTAASASRADVQACFDILDYGDTVHIPACAAGDCTWTSGITFTKNASIVGAGVDTTILTAGFTNNSVEEAFFKFIPDATSRANLDSLADTATVDISGITFAGSSRMEDKFGLKIYNTYAPLIRRVRIHNNKFTNLHRAIQTTRYVEGVFYLNTLENTNAGYPLGNERGSWDNYPTTPGDGRGWYIEDNTMSFSSNTGVITAAGHGATHIIRYNTVTGASETYFESHGNQLALIRGSQVTEVYGNSFANSASGVDIDLRGGKAFIFFNKSASVTGWQLREEFTDAQTGTLLNNACTEDGPQICADSCVCMKLNHSYFFNNRKISDNSVGSFSVLEGYDFDPPELVSDREFFNYQTSFDGTTGVGCGTVAAMNAITPTTTGVGFWATDQDNCTTIAAANIGAEAATPLVGTLYRWSGAAWVAYYTPYTYPHLLRDPVVSPPVLAAISIASNGTSWNFTYSEPVSGDPTSDLCDAFTATMTTAGAIAFSYASGNGTDAIVCTGNPAVNIGDTIANGGVDYTQPGNGIEATTGGADLVSFSNKPITNNSTAGAPTTRLLTASVVGSATITSGDDVAIDCGENCEGLYTDASEGVFTCNHADNLKHVWGGTGATAGTCTTAATCTITFDAAYGLSCTTSNLTGQAGLGAGGSIGIAR